MDLAPCREKGRQEICEKCRSPECGKEEANLRQTCLCAFRVLRVPRIAIHKNLFASLSFHCIIMIIFKSLVLLPYIQNNGHDETMLQEVPLTHSTLSFFCSNQVHTLPVSFLWPEYIWLSVPSNAFQVLSSHQLHMDVLWGLLPPPTLGQHLRRGAQPQGHPLHWLGYVWSQPHAYNQPDIDWSLFVTQCCPWFHVWPMASWGCTWTTPCAGPCQPPVTSGWSGSTWPRVSSASSPTLSSFSTFSAFWSPNFRPRTPTNLPTLGRQFTPLSSCCPSLASIGCWHCIGRQRAVTVFGTPSTSIWMSSWMVSRVSWSPSPFATETER